MIQEIPFFYRSGKGMVQCSNCGHVQNVLPSLSLNEFFQSQIYLDNLRVGVENKYFNTKYQTCEKCGNFGDTLFFNIFKNIEQDVYDKILFLNIEDIEKRLLIMSTITNSTQSLLDLYWYYDFNNKKEVVEYRDKLIKLYTEKFNKTKDKHSLRMLVELLRRKGEFDVAIKLAKSYRNLPQNDFNKYLDKTNPYENDILKLEIKLCKKKDCSRMVF